MLKVGITGSIGSGKTTVSCIFEQLGVPVYNADTRAKELMNTDTQLKEKIVTIFGKEAFDGGGLLNRAYLSAKAFTGKGLLEQLNAAVHPVVFADFDNWLLRHSHEAYILKEAALMFESDSYKGLDKIIVVTAPEELRIARTMQRDGSARQQVLDRMANQFSQEKKKQLAHYEIVNDEKHLVIPQVLDLHRDFIKT